VGGRAAGGWRLAAGGWRLAAGGWRLAAEFTNLRFTKFTKIIYELIF
jgi:hypothetical protein